MKILVLFIALLISNLALAILPEDIGGTQYATGHLVAAEKYREVIKDDVLYEQIKKLLLCKSSEVSGLLEEMFPTVAQRKKFLQDVLEIQNEVISDKPKLIMIGKNRAVATDGHHRVRGQVKIDEILTEGGKLWPDEMKSLLTPLERVAPDGSFIIALPLEKYRLISELPAESSARDVVRELLANKQGLWKDPELQALAEKYYGKKASGEIGKHELQKLAEAMGIADGPKGILFTPVADLPDGPTRSLLGTYFDSRGLKDDVEFKSYVEFFVGDDLKEFTQKNPGKYPFLEKFLENTAPSFEFQEKNMSQAMNEIDSILVSEKKLEERILSYVFDHSSRAQGNLTKAKIGYCQGAGKKSPVCLKWLEEVKDLSGKYFGKCSLENHKNCNCIMKSLNDLLKVVH